MMVGYEWMGGIIEQVHLYQDPVKLRVVVAYSTSPKIKDDTGKVTYMSRRDITLKSFDVEVREQFDQLHEHLKKQGYTGG